MKMKQQIKKLTGKDVYVPEYEDIKKSDRVNSAGRACYVERNYWMIDDSDFVTILFIEGKRCMQSGTLKAYAYSMTKGKEVIKLNPDLF